jgi:hypothetical protein
MRRSLKEIQKLQLKILELEKKEKEKGCKKTSLDYNFSVINNVLSENKNKLKPVPLAIHYDQELFTHLETINNILKNLDERLKNLEENNMNLRK